MSGDNVFRAMSDEELAEWDRTRRRADQAERDLQESRKATAAVQASLMDELDAAKREACKYATEVMEWRRRFADMQQAARRSAGEVVQLLAALGALVGAIERADLDHQNREHLLAFVKAMKEAKEVLALKGIPF